jgi:hypothetical protein
MRKLLLITLVLLGFTCKKKSSGDCSQAVCPLISIAAPVVKFTFTDKITNKDLFFGSSPQFQLKDLVVFKKKNATDTTQLPVYIDSANQKYFKVITPQDATTIFLQIQNQKVDTVDVTIKPVISNCCVTGYIFGILKLNGKEICVDCPFPTILDIKK